MRAGRATFPEQNHERFQYDTLLWRAQHFEVLLGQPDFSLEHMEEEDFKRAVAEVNAQAGMQGAVALPMLLQVLADWARIDPAVWKPA